MQHALEQAQLSINNLLFGIIDRAPFIVLGLFVFLLFYVAGRLTRRLAYRLSTRAQRHNNVGLVIGRLGQGVAILTGALVASVIAIPGFTVGQLFSILGVGSVAIGFAFRDILQNFLAGILLLLNQPFRIGDQIVAKDLEGTVEDIQTRATFIRTYDGRRVVVPNSDLFTNLVTVNTAFETRRLEHVIGISYDDDIETAIAVLEGVMRHAPSVMDAPEPDAFVIDFNDSSIDIQMFWWISSPYQKDVIYSRGEVLRQAKRALDEAGITIPFPIRTLDFGLARRNRGGDGNNKLLADWLRRTAGENDVSPSNGDRNGDRNGDNNGDNNRGARVELEKRDQRD